MNTDLSSEIELAKMLLKFCQTVRKSEKRPALAAVAAQREMRCETEVAELERQRDLLETPELALGAGKRAS